jgi:hypothetical protein
MACLSQGGTVFGRATGELQRKIFVNIRTSKTGEGLFAFIGPASRDAKRGADRRGASGRR